MLINRLDMWNKQYLKTSILNNNKSEKIFFSLLFILIYNNYKNLLIFLCSSFMANPFDTLHELARCFGT